VPSLRMIGRIMNSNRLLLGILTASAMFAASGSGGGGSGGGGNTGGVTPSNAAEVRTPNERIPAGGTVQVKFLLTQPRPIGSSGSSFFTSGFDVNGVAISSTLGDAAGAAVWQNGLLRVSVVSPNADFGMTDYPFMTATLSVPATSQMGATYPLALSDGSFMTALGPLTVTDPKPGVLTIGGSISIHNIVPGGGTWPAGTVVNVEGTGFLPLTKLTAKMRMSPAVYDSPTAMHFTLQDSATTMDMQPITASNPDGSQVTYNSYLRGVLIQSPSRSLLNRTDPIFQLQTHGIATVGPLSPMSSGQYAALAFQNPTPGPVVVTLMVNSSGAVTTITLPSGGRVVDDISALLGGTSLGPNDTVTVTSTSLVQMLGLYCDENAGTVTPFLPSF
jgi:hypothetical protein